MLPQNSFHKPSKGARLTNKDYTRFVRWTPTNIAKAMVLIGLPYVVVVVVLAVKFSLAFAGLLMFLLALVLAIVGAMYWLARLKL